MDLGDFSPGEPLIYLLREFSTLSKPSQGIFFPRPIFGVPL